MAVTLRSVGISPAINSTTCIIVKPAGLAVGDLMIAQVGLYAPRTITPPSGWTLIRTDAGATIDQSSLYTKIAVQADVDATDFTFTLSATTNNKGAISAWYGHDATTPINAHNGQYNATASTTVTSPQITPLVANCMILMVGSHTANATFSDYAIQYNNPASWNEAYDLLYYGGASIAMGYAIRPETTATGLGTITISASSSNTGQLVAIAPVAGVTHYGAATLSGSGVLAGIGRGIFAGKSTLSGTGLLSAIGRGIFAAKATLTGVGTLTANAVTTLISKATLAGTGLLSAIGVRIYAAKATLAGIGSLATAGSFLRYGASTLAGIGTLTAKGVITAIGKVILAGAGTLTGLGRLIAIGKSTLSGTGTLAAVGRGVFISKATLAGTGLLSAIGGVYKLGAAILSGIGTLIGIGHITAIGKATLSGIGSLSAIGAFFRLSQIKKIARIPDRTLNVTIPDRSLDQIATDRDINIKTITE